MRYQDIGLCLFRKASTLILAFSWILGLWCGIMLVHCAQGSIVSLMRGCVFTSVSIVSLSLACIFPFLFSALAVFLSFPWVLLFVCFGKAFLVSFLLTGLTFAWGDSAWVICCAVMFCDLAYSPALYCFWLRQISGEREYSSGECLTLLLIGLLIVSAAHGLLIPFFAEVMIL